MSQGKFDLFDNDTIDSAFRGGGSLADVIERAAAQQAKRDAYIAFHGKLITAVFAIFAVISLVTIAAYGAVVVGLLLALFTVIQWQTFGVLVGIALSCYLVNAILLRPVGKKFGPLFKRRRELRQAARENTGV